MAYPSFSKASMTTLTLSRGPSYPEDHQYVPRQTVTYSEAGQARVVTYGAPEEIFPLIFARLPTADVDALLAWFSHALINWSASKFTYTDIHGTARTVRYAGGTFTRSQTASNLYDVTLLLRKELF